MTNDTIPAQPLTLHETMHGFTLERIETIRELRSTAYLFTHAKTGARLLHLFNDDPENLFSIAFRTPVHDDTGVPHILEHSVLCGSKKFPVKDPFQEMMKGSLQTFLNALTYRDKTVYPVASQLEKDFFNLVNVYCDAVFHPLLTRNTFYQEGWHFEVDDKRPEGNIGIKGIVYNEMNGVFSDFASHVARKTIAGLMPDTPYAFESGGDPEHITDLSYEGFVDFHRRFYHPSNSCIFLYGNIASATSLRFLNDNYLGAFSGATPLPAIATQPLWQSPRRLDITAPATEECDGTASVLIAWIFGDSADPLSVLCGTVLGHYLLGTESSPLKRALVDSGLGEDLDETSGFGVEAVQSVFVAGLRKTRPEHAETILALTLDVLREQLDKGMNDELFEGALRQVEFGLREKSNGNFPYHLKLAERCYNSWLYGGDPMAHLAFEKTLDAVKSHQPSMPAFFREAIRHRLLDNSHRLHAVIIGSFAKGRELERQTELQAAKLSASFSTADRKRYGELARDLAARQNEPIAPEALATLPRLVKADLPPQGFEVPCETGTIDGVPCYAHPIFTSDIVYFDIGFNLRRVPEDLIPYLPLYLELLRRCGTVSCPYERMATRIALATGGIGTSAISRTAAGSASDLFFHAFIHGKSLRPRFGAMLDILHELLTEPDLANARQLKDILFEERNELNASVIGNGHHMAMYLASSPLSESRRIEELLGGISQLRFLDRLAKQPALDDVIPKLIELHSIVVDKNSCVISVTADTPENLTKDIAAFVSSLPARQASSVSRQKYPGTEKTLYNGSVTQGLGVEINAAVNFAARAWRLPTPTELAPERHGLLLLMARHLTTGYLWDKVRVEGGAYGGMAIVSAAHPIFSCVSYRDPNIVPTLRHFEQCLLSIESELDAAVLDKSIIGAIGRIDQPKSPHGQGFGETIDRLCGFSPAERQRLREAVLGATPEKLKQAARSIVYSQESSIAVLGNAMAFDVAANEGFSFRREPLLG